MPAELLGAATEVIWHGLRRSVEHGDPGVRVSPLLLDGPAGIGKSHLARKLAALVGVPSIVVEATNENASFGIVGSQRSWGNSAPGRLINFILSEGVANPIVIIDELEKAGDVRASKGQSFSLTEALLPMLEPLSAARWTCPYFEVPFDMRWVGWVMTTNNFRLLPDPLLSRCPPKHRYRQSLRLSNTDGFKFRKWDGAFRGKLGSGPIDLLEAAVAG